MTIERAFFNILSNDLEKSREFYVDFIGLEVTFKSDWFINLRSTANDALELGILKRDHEATPTSGRGTPKGGMLTIIVDDADKAFERAKEFGVTIVEEPKNLFYGQRRLVVEDPDGTLIDISARCEPDAEWVKRLRQAEDGSHYEADE